MNKILLVDDEQATKDGIRFFIESNQFNLEIIAEAENGEEALEKIKEFNPDIVMTDIKMPVMDGIELALHIKEEYPHIKIIFISGYEDINYLRSAIKVDAVDYILKPVRLTELNTVFSRVSSDLSNEKQKKQYIYDMERRIMQSMPLLRQRLLMLMVNGWMDDIDSIRSQMEFLDIKFPNEERLCVVCISTSNYKGTVENMSFKEKQCLTFAALNIFQEIVDKFMTGYTFENTLGEFVGILSLDKEEYENDLIKLADEVKKHFMEVLELDATLYVGEITNSLAELFVSYESAKMTIGNEIFIDKDRTISIDSISNVNYDSIALDKTYNQITKLLRGIAEEELYALIDTIFNELENDEVYSGHYKLNICVQLVVCGMRVFNEIGRYSSAIEAYEYQTMQKITKPIELEEAKTIVLQYYSYICSNIRDRRKNKSGRNIKAIKSIIEKHYMKNLKIDDIAGEVFLSPTYMCLIFKKETGMTINEYLTHVRIEKSKKLLEDNVKPGNVGILVGYENQSYFAKLFKRYVGCTPSEYGRKKDE